MHKNGLDLKEVLRQRRALANAVFSDVQRTIITPNVADRPNMMQGVIRINNEGKCTNVRQSFNAWILDLKKQILEVKLIMLGMALLFQFYSYGISSVKRLTTNLVQNRDGVSPAISGGLLVW